MSPFLLLALLWQPPVASKRMILETGGQLLLIQFPTCAKRLEDGTFLFASAHKVWHFHADGTLKNRFGRRGQGPNEYQFITNVHWDGKHYWVGDGNTQTTSQVTGGGKFVKKRDYYFYDLYTLAGETWALHADIRFWKDERPRMFYPVKLPSGKKMSAGFHELSHQIVALKYNFTDHFADSDSRFFYVTDQITPVVKIYGREKKNLNEEIPLKLPGFVRAPEHFLADARKVSSKTWRIWWASFSKVTGMAKLKTGFVVAYEVPHPRDETETLTVLCRVDERGQNPSAKSFQQAFFLGVSGNEVAVMIPEEEPHGERYAVAFYRWDL